MKIFVCVILLLAAVLDAEALQCYNILEYDCTAYDYSLLSTCRDVEAENTRFIETCPSSADSCYYSSFYVNEPGLYNLRITTGGCEYSDISGCYSRSQLATIDPTIEYTLKDIEDEFGVDVQGLQTCFCTTNLCNTGLSYQTVTPTQGVVTPRQKTGALQCYNILEYDCTAYDYSLLSTCRDVEAENTRFIETCPSSANSCYYSKFDINEPGLYNLKTIIGGCENGYMNGCYSRSQLATIDPAFEYTLDDIEDEFGVDIQGLQACFCTSNLCNSGLSYQIVTHKQGSVTPTQSNGSLLVQTSYMIVGLLALTVLLHVIDFTVM